MRRKVHTIWLSCESCSKRVRRDTYGHPRVGWSQFGTSRFKGHEHEPANYCPSCVAAGKHREQPDDSQAANQEVAAIIRETCEKRVDEAMNALWSEYEEVNCSCHTPDVCYFHQHLTHGVESAKIAGYAGTLGKFVAARQVAYAEGVVDAPAHSQTALAARDARVWRAAIEAAALVAEAEFVSYHDAANKIRALRKPEAI